MSRNAELILFANDAFYAAFASGDAAAMDDLWAQSAPLVCIHPGAAPLFERDDIISSWQGILSSDQVGDMSCLAPRLVNNDGLALVVCYEQLGGGTLVATNGFVLEDSRWRMVLHQAGPCAEPPNLNQSPNTPH